MCQTIKSGNVIILILNVIALLEAASLHSWHTGQDVYHTRIIALADELGRGQIGKAELHRLLSEPRFQGLALEDDSPNEWVVETPLEFGATNWILYMDVRESKVVGVRIRTADSKGDHPKGAPPDKFLPL